MNDVRDRRQVGWYVSVAGLFLSVFAVVALSGPGRIDIVDGQTRYEVARSIVDHGDHVIRDPNVWFGVFPGRGGQRFTHYRFPQTAAGVVAILASDATGPISEARRHFFFSLIGAVACGCLAAAFALWFRSRGSTSRDAILWAAAGILCTPLWIYGTSSFDDILGSVAVVLAVIVAFDAKLRRRWTGALLAGLLTGLAFNCKQPLGIFVLPVLAAVADAGELRARLIRGAIVMAGLIAGVVTYVGYNAYKFPPGTMAANADLFAQYIPVWPGHPGMALLDFAFSPGAGLLFYCPPILIGIPGIASWLRRESRIAGAALVLACGVFTLFVASLSIFKGDPAWGPRYLTPLVAVVWLAAPDGARLIRRPTVRALLLAGLVVQLLGLSVDPHRLYVELGLPSAFGAVFPELYFDPAVAHLVNRPREILEIARDEDRPDRFSPSPSPTFAFPVIDSVQGGEAAVRRYRVLSSFRPWWISQRYLEPGRRPVDIGRTATFLVLLAILGGVAAWLGHPLGSGGASATVQHASATADLHEPDKE